MRVVVVVVADDVPASALGPTAADAGTFGPASPTTEKAAGFAGRLASWLSEEDQDLGWLTDEANDPAP